MHRLEQYSCHKCMETVKYYGWPMLIFEKFGVVLKAIDIVATYCALGYQPSLSKLLPSLNLQTV